MKKIILLILSAAMAFSCADQPIGSIPMDSEAPGQITDIVVTNVPGGADISYRIPSDNDLLYVKASYELENGTPSSVMVSMYEDTLKVRGFAKSQERQVRITTGDRSGNESAPVLVTISPKRSPIFDVLESVRMEGTFGGVRLSWRNETKSALAVTLLKKVGVGKWEEVNTYYSDAGEGRQAARGMEAEEAEFAVFIKDRWENVSDTVTATLTPLFEEQFPVGTYKKYAMAGDSEISYGWDLGFALDGNTSQAYGWFSKPSVEGGVWPARFTIRIAGGALVSRVRIIQRHSEMWENGNPKKFNVYATNSPSSDGSNDGWTLLKTFTSVKPSGYGSGQYSDEDIYIAQNGEDFEFDPEKVAKYEYYRFEFTENWGGDNTFINLYEIFFYGKI